ncbi:MAG: DEAD/DEAH box helicase [Magnetovibrionaceae bacterium]
MTTFEDLGLSDPILRAVKDAGYNEPTPIQEQAIPFVMMGRDILGAAQTGTGKTASFTLPMIDVLSHGRAKARMPRTLILEPTRELAAQVAENFEKYGKYLKLNMALLIGGTAMEPQMKKIDRGVDVLIATPGRLLDLFDRGMLILRDVKILVIDEADRMLDMGFIPDVERIVSLLPPLRQTLFFSATMPPEIKNLADKFLMNPKEITVARTSSAAETVTQGLLVVKHSDGKRPDAGKKEKRDALRRLIAREEIRNAIIFCNRKRDVGILCRSLNKHGLNAGQLHGDMSQHERMEMLEKFKNGEVIYLCCSDVAARGIDIAELSHVFNFDVPTHAEDYVHRIGRTGRAGREGKAYSLAIPEDGKYVSAIESLIGREIPKLTLDNDADPVAGGELVQDEKPKRGRRRGKPKSATTETSEPQTEPTEAKPVEANQEVATEVKAEADPKPERSAKRGRGRRRDRDQDRDDTPIVGFGDHVPSFLLQAVFPDGKPEDEDEKPKKKVPAKRKTTKRAPAKKKASTEEAPATDSPSTEAPAEAALEPSALDEAPSVEAETVAQEVEQEVVQEVVQEAEEEAKPKKPARKRAAPKKTATRKAAPRKKKADDPKAEASETEPSSDQPSEDPPAEPDTAAE